jgi:hypothetical protein
MPFNISWRKGRRPPRPSQAQVLKASGEPLNYFFITLVQVCRMFARGANERDSWQDACTCLNVCRPIQGKNMPARGCYLALNVENTVKRSRRVVGADPVWNERIDFILAERPQVSIRVTLPSCYLGIGTPLGFL